MAGAARPTGRRGVGSAGAAEVAARRSMHGVGPRGGLLPA